MSDPTTTDTDPGAHAVELLRRCGVLTASAPTTTVVTHAAVIVLNDDRAWKLKRPVTYRYLDFSSVDQRRTALSAEYELNLRTAPQLYRAVHAITDAGGREPGGLEFDGAGTTVDYVLEMARFPDDALLADHVDAGLLDDALTAALAEQVVALHARSPISDDPAGAARILDVVVGNRGSMARFPQILDPARADALTDRLTALIDTHAPLLDARARAGRVRRGHGDLHLNNLVLLDGVPTPFDALEFDPELATTDVLYDLAFVLMDLWHRGRTREANVLVNAYFDASPEDEEAYLLLPLFISVRATVLAHVRAASGDPDSARAYLALALALLDPVPPRLVAIGGASGTGKTTVARAVACRVGGAPGARILRSDVIRKRLAGSPVLEPLPASGYAPEMSARVYAELERLAALHLNGQTSVLVDAVSGRPQERAALAAVAEATSSSFLGIWLELAESERIARILGRGPDASDATPEVARAQTRALVPPDASWCTVAADGRTVDEVVAELAR
ncbi:hypothetical protein GOHSU_19_00380 [Gordonia hirsuta DSM 44140 = NBRC 16056]|uniref:Aminoglycoside phosphotransferase domain-containing protein n=1 Tax=Gordonia hirsuta DSM 44140 = NBRC 16056 TaxID=1121927 RepID=L7LBL7_9ACTN|nr:AAA family ATPase [Gordonia hirsuta]GAC57433.1 hypothetical protein GOHSU_19_00380 [Gordonia hirsuta DSM 44140 = NBRC 16056]